MHQEVVAAAIFLGLIVSVPVMLLFASLFRQGAEQIILQGFVAVQVHTSVASVVCSIVVLGFLCSSICLARCFQVMDSPFSCWSNFGARSCRVRSTTHRHHYW